MKEVINHLKLQEAANEEQVLEAIINMESDLSSKNKLSLDSLTGKNAEIAELKKAIAELEEEKVIKNKAASLEFVNNKIEEGVYTEAQRSSLLEKAEADLESFKLITGSINISKVSNDITNLITKTGIPSEDTEDNTLDGKTFREIEKTGKAGERVLNKLKAENPKKWDAMFEAEYKIKSI